MGKSKDKSRGKEGGEDLRIRIAEQGFLKGQELNSFPKVKFDFLPHCDWGSTPRNLA